VRSSTSPCQRLIGHLKSPAQVHIMC